MRSFVLSDGTLDEQKVLKKERVYQGMNGRFVERFYITPDQSYIFKPLTNDSQLGKEMWIYTHFLQKLPSFYPRVIDFTSEWIIFEDLGIINHHFSDESVLNITTLIAKWHKIPDDLFETTTANGPKPSFKEVVKQLEIRMEEVISLASKHDISPKTIEFLFSQLENVPIDHKKVFSHGDLHLGNYGYARGKLYIIDWEHAHLNSPYWDLYHLLDISHPNFPKRITKELRNLALDLYMNEAVSEGGYSNRSTFKLQYYLFSSVFSLWMLLLIEADLQRNEGKWSENQLKQQEEETVLCLKHCLEEIQTLLV